MGDDVPDGTGADVIGPGWATVRTLAFTRSEMGAVGTEDWAPDAQEKPSPVGGAVGTPRFWKGVEAEDKTWSGGVKGSPWLQPSARGRGPWWPGTPRGWAGLL